MPKKYCDDIISRANGNISIIEKELGFPEGYFSDGGGLIRIDVPNTSELNIHIPSGNEIGANKIMDSWRKNFWRSSRGDNKYNTTWRYDNYKDLYSLKENKNGL